MTFCLTSPETRKQFGQWMTPAWATEELVDRYYRDLTGRDMVVEPSCGEGAFIKPFMERGIPVIGVEIDETLAAYAREDTGAPVVVGDFRTIPLDFQPTAIVGNPPYSVSLVKGFLARAARLLPDGGRCGFILPAYLMQTHGNVIAWNKVWSLSAEVLPRRIFPRLRLPLLFVQLRKEQIKTMIGFALYEQAVEIDSLRKSAKLILARPQRMGAWRALVTECLKLAGGKASLDELYQMIEPKRPTGNRWWKEKVRQTLQYHFERVSPGVWSVMEEAQA
ncbi:MAG TPA: SAM-dependent methyltransferase [Nitrospiraceae bacterium]|nr:SAM-dependent methyltransferase [Nitrospiraceae bacterium]